MHRERYLQACLFLLGAVIDTLLYAYSCNSPSNKFRTDHSTYTNALSMPAIAGLLNKNIMLTLNRTRILNTLIKHETLTIGDIAKEENLGMIPNEDHLNLLLLEMNESGYINILHGVTPCTYTITDKGIRESARINAEG